MKRVLTSSKNIYPNGDKYDDNLPTLAEFTLLVRNPYSVGSPRWKAYNRALRDYGRIFVVMGKALFVGGEGGVK